MSSVCLFKKNGNMVVTDVFALLALARVSWHY